MASSRGGLRWASTGGALRSGRRGCTVIALCIAQTRDRIGTIAQEHAYDEAVASSQVKSIKPSQITAGHVKARQGTARQGTARHGTAWQVTSRQVRSRQTKSSQVTSSHVTSRHVKSHHVTSSHITSRQSQEHVCDERPSQDGLMKQRRWLRGARLVARRVYTWRHVGRHRTLDNERWLWLKLLLAHRSKVALQVRVGVPVEVLSILCLAQRNVEAVDVRRDSPDWALRRLCLLRLGWRASGKSSVFAGRFPKVRVSGRVHERNQPRLAVLPTSSQEHQVG